MATDAEVHLVQRSVDTQLCKSTHTEDAGRKERLGRNEARVRGRHVWVGSKTAWDRK